MKKIIYLSFLLLSGISYSQEHKWYVGGGMNANISSSNEHNGINWQAKWNLSPEIGTYITPNIQVGGNLAIGEKLTRSGGGTSRIPELAAGLYGRYLFGENAFHPFVGLRVGYGINGSSWNSLSNGSSINSILVNAGVLYNINPRWTCFGSLGAFGYTGTRYNSSGSDIVTRNLGFNLNTIGNRLVVGLYYNFGRAL